jgi:hypothetical protein
MSPVGENSPVGEATSGVPVSLKACVPRTSVACTPVVADRQMASADIAKRFIRCITLSLHISLLNNVSLHISL